MNVFLCMLFTAFFSFSCVVAHSVCFTVCVRDGSRRELGHAAIDREAGARGHKAPCVPRHPAPQRQVGLGDPRAGQVQQDLARHVPDARDGRRGVRRRGIGAARRRRRAQLPRHGHVAPGARLRLPRRHPRSGRGRRRDDRLRSPWQPARRRREHVSRGAGAGGRRRRWGGRSEAGRGRGRRLRDAAAAGEHGRGLDDEPAEAEPLDGWRRRRVAGGRRGRGRHEPVEPFLKWAYGCIAFAGGHHVFSMCSYEFCAYVQYVLGTYAR
uniref:Uncharacterized protein n=1 Tax=Oryza glaberrima TaxID=4538 RepID=I1P6X2_ORYGL